MRKFDIWFISITIIGACTCGVRTDCGNRAEMSLLTGVHDDPSCRKLSAKGVLMYEAAKLLAEIHNNKSGGFDIELAVQDTCGSITGALKAAMKALVAADMNCLQPPYYLGIIGPDTATNAEAVQKITSVLKIPHIVRKPSPSPYLHHLPKESNSYIVQAIMEVMENLKWKSFTLVANADEDNDDDVQNIAKKLTIAAIGRNLCVLIHNDDDDDYTSQIVHIGKPEVDFFTEPVNATIIVVSEGNLEDHLNHVNSSNTILLLEDTRDELAGLESRVEKSKWWPGNQGLGKYDAEELRDVRWLEEAINVYAKALDTLCKKKKCKTQVNAVDWNNVISNVLSSRNAEVQSSIRYLDFSMKTKAKPLSTLGYIAVRKTNARIHWGDEKATGDDDDDDDDQDGKDDDDDDHDDDGVPPDHFKKIISREKKGGQTGCATNVREIKMLDENDDDEEAAPVLVSEMDDSEWWTMVMTVSGVGVAMFAIGILAVYIVIANIRGPKPPKGSSSRFDGSLRRVGSDREMPNSGSNARANRFPQRRDSNRSITSNLSEKSV